MNDARTSMSELEAAVAEARAAAPIMATLPSHERARILRRAADLVEEEGEALAAMITERTGKVIKDARREVERAPWTLRLAATAAEQLYGEQIPGDALPAGAGSFGLTLRVPVGVVAAITPFNAPLNLTAHKVGPAIAAGNAVVMKPSPRCPEIAFALATILTRAGLPAGALTIVEGSADVAVALAAHADVDLVSFTGSPEAGEAIRRAASYKRVVLELGGNAANVVHDDADLDLVVPAVLRGGFANQGQSCNSVQRLIVHRDVAGELEVRLVAALGELRVGDPADPCTDVGPVVDEAAAQRILGLVTDATRRGARVAFGGTRAGRHVAPTLVADLTSKARLLHQEAFGPVVGMLRYDDLDDAVRVANDTRFALQAAIFTNRLDVALRMARELRAGGVVVNQSSNFRLDHLPYGGHGYSGQGREGPARAVLEFTEEKTVLFAPTN